jgi:DNA repair protein RadC
MTASSFHGRSYHGYRVELRIRRRNHRYEPILADGPHAIYEFMCDLKNESAEHAYELLLDAKNRIHGVYEIGKGAIDMCVVDPKEVFKAALVTNSVAFTLVHNHPSGMVEPSTHDFDLTNRIAAGADLLGIRFLDSIILGDSRYFSFSAAGLMPYRTKG